MEELVRKAQKGDEQAFYELITGAKERLYNTAYQYLKDQHSALEAVAETTCRAYIKIGSLREPRFFSTWITRILINYCLDELKYISKNSPANLAELSLVYIQYEDQGTEVKSDLLSALKLIKPKYRDVIILKYLEDVPTAEISKILNKPEGTIKTWINRGLKQMRSKMKGSEQYA